MANFRQIHVKIWKDNWFLDLHPEEKLLWIYLFSNDLTNLSGIYQISQKIIAFETGLDYRWVDDALKNLQAQGKLEYEDGYIWIKKLRKYHETSSPKVQIRIQKDLDNIPDIPIKTRYIAYYQPAIPYSYPMDSETQEEEEEYKEEEESDELLSFLKHWKTLFPDKPQPRKKTISKRFKTRIKEKYFYDNWLKALGVAAESRLCKDSGWFTALWFLKNDTNWEKCLDGNYADGLDPQQQKINRNREVITKVAQEYVDDES